MDSTLIKSLSEVITNGETFAIITHRRPDGDAISSSLAMFWYLLDIGKEQNNIDVIIPEFIDDFSFIPGIQHLKKIPTKEEYDVVIIVDCVNLQFLEGHLALNRAKQIVCFDHHEETSITSDYSIIDSTAPSCTCILYEVFHCTNEHFLSCIATGLISDTVNLTLNLTSRGKDIIDALAELGIDINYILSKLSVQNSRTMELVLLAIERGYFVNLSGHSIFCTYLLQKDLLDSEKNLNAVNHKAIVLELQKLVKYTSLILLLENDKGEFKGSLRTFDTKIDLNSICSKLVSEGKLIKGGGHSYSSGCTAIGPYTNIFSLIVSEIVKNY